jgi:hypothetical protein
VLPSPAAAQLHEWASLGALLGQIIAAYRSSLPDSISRQALDTALAGLLECTAVSEDACLR